VLFLRRFGFVGATVWMFLVMFAIEASLPGADDFHNFDFLEGLSIAFAITTILSVLGFRLMRGRPRLVLFLRRFGFVGATEALTFAVNMAIGGSWRMVTLDDQEIAPMGTGRGPHWTSILGGLVGIAILVGLYGLAWLPLEREAVGLLKPFDNAFGLPYWMAWMVFPFAPAVIGAVLGLMAILALWMFLALAVCGLILYFCGSYVAVYRAERSKKLRIEDSLEVDTITRLLVRRSRRVFAARLVVVRVATPAWHQAVRGLG